MAKVAGSPTSDTSSKLSDQEPELPSPTLDETVSRLEDWEEKFEDEYLERHEKSIEFQTDSQLVQDLLMAAGDYNPLHFKKGLEQAQDKQISEDEFQEFLDEVLDEEGIGQPHWNEERHKREINDVLTGAVNPGMVYTTAAALEVDGSIGRIESSWEDASWIGDHLMIEEEDLRYYAEASTPESEEYDEKGSIEFETGDYGSDNNIEKIAAANQVVARRDRSGDMLLSLDIDFYEDINWEEIDWNDIEFVEENLEDIQEIENGDMMSYKTEIQVDDTVIGEASEMYVDTDNYGVIEARYGSDSFASVFALSATTPIALTTSTMRASNAAMELMTAYRK